MVQSEDSQLPLFALDLEGVETPLVVCLSIIVAGLAKIGYNHAEAYQNKYTKSIPECCLLIFLGVIAGETYYLIHTEHLGSEVFTAHLFFVFILPPIMLEAGYFLPKRPFFDNLGTILTYAVFGTLINAFGIGLTLFGVYKAGGFGAFEAVTALPTSSVTNYTELSSSNFTEVTKIEIVTQEKNLTSVEFLLFGSIMSAVDPVTVIAVFQDVHVHDTLYISVFGESILNDGVAVVLFQVFESFIHLGPGSITPTNIYRSFLKFSIVAGGGTIIGLLFGYLGSFIFRVTFKYELIEPLLIFTICYVSYLVAEMMELSAILAIIFCAFVMMHRVDKRLSKDSHVVIRNGLKMMSQVAEIIIFILLGVTCVEGLIHSISWNTALFFVTLLSITVFRFLSVFLLTFILNFTRKKPIGIKDQLIIAVSGLRGGIAFSLTKLVTPNVIPQIDTFMSTTIAIILFTSFLQGGAISFLVDSLKIEKAGQEQIAQRHKRNVAENTACIGNMLTRQALGFAGLNPDEEMNGNEIHQNRTLLPQKTLDVVDE